VSIRIVMMFDSNRNQTNILLKNSLFYICGPPGMVKAMQNLVQNELQIQKEQIKIEEFTGY
jgi:glycine betaine catabolism B